MTDVPEVLSTSRQPTTRRRAGESPTRSGAWRPDDPFVRGEGLRVTMRHERGVTPKGYLRVPFRFQAPPLDRYGRRWEMDFPTYDTIREGERPQQGSPRLQRPSFQTMFVDERYNWLVWRGSYDVQRMVLELREILQRGAPFRLTVSQPALWGPRPLTDIVVVMTSLAPEGRGGEVGTEYADVEFLQWPGDKLQRRRPNDSDQKRRHELKAGDTLYKIALAAKLPKSQWRLIRDANGIKNVAPDSAEDLARWAKNHDRKSLKIPAYEVEAAREAGQAAGEAIGRAA